MVEHERFLGVLEGGRIFPVQKDKDNDLFYDFFSDAVGRAVEESFKQVNYKYSKRELSDIVRNVYDECAPHLSSVISGKIESHFGDLLSG